MAIRTNCIEYGWETSLLTINSSSYYSSSFKTIYIPENINRTFDDAMLQVHTRNDGQGGASQFGFISSIQIDSNPTESISYGTIVNNTPEQISGTFLQSVRSYFNTYFTSSRHNVKWYFRSSGAPDSTNQIGTTAKILLTYSFEDADVTTSIKTIRLPINTISAATLTTSEVYLGNHTGSIPSLDAYLPEVSKSYKDIFIEYHANDASTATTNFNLKTRIDTAPSQSRFVVSQSLQSAAYYYDIEVLSGSIATNTTHSIRISSTLTNRFTGICGILYATYEYDYTGSSQIMCSNIYGTKPLNVTNALGLKPVYFNIETYIPTTGSVILRRSGLYFTQNGATTTQRDITTDTSSYIAYTYQNGTLQTGATPTIHQLDGTGSSDSPIALEAGTNNVVVYIKNSSIGTYGGDISCGILYLNYLMNIDSGYKPLSYPTTICRYLHTSNTSVIPNGSSFGFNLQYSASLALNGKYYIDNLTNIYYYRYGKSANVPIYSIMYNSIFSEISDIYQFQINPIDINMIAWANDARYEFIIGSVAMENVIVRYPEFIPTMYNPKLNLSNTHSYQSRLISVSNNSVSGFNHMQYIVKYQKTFDVSGSIQNYSGSGAGINLTVYDSTNGMMLFQTQSLSGGVINTQWYNGHNNLFIVANTGSGYISNTIPAGSGSFVITIPSSSAVISSGEKSFTFIS